MLLNDRAPQYPWPVSVWDELTERARRVESTLAEDPRITLRGAGGPPPGTVVLLGCNDADAEARIAGIQ